MVSVPTGSESVAQVAMPDDRATDPQPSMVLPFDVKATVPVRPGVGATVAVKVTDWPSTDGFRLEVSVTLLAASGDTSAKKYADTLPISGEFPVISCALSG